MSLPIAHTQNAGRGEGIAVKLEKVDCDETCHKSESSPTITQSIDKLKKTRIQKKNNPLNVY